MASVIGTPQSIASALATWPLGFTVANLSAKLGDIPAERIILKPIPGTATEQDLIDLQVHEHRLCELIDGILVEKSQVGVNESSVAFELIVLLGIFLKEHNLGVGTAPDGPYRLLPLNVRYPDVAFIRWESLPGGRLPEEAISPIPPDLAIEVLSKGNTKKEMDRKLRDYFAAGVKLVWYIDPKTKSAKSYTDVDLCTMVEENGELVGDPVLPGFRVKLSELFASAERLAPPANG